MTYQPEVWKIIEENEDKQVWDKVFLDFNFTPSIDNSVIPFTFKIPVDIYDITDSLIWYDNKEINEKIRLSFIECMKDNDYIYALDWQHTSFRYNPRIIDNNEYPVFVKYDVPIKNEHVDWEGYNVWFPTFYPNGDYFFFIAEDFSWGYLTHPWLNKVYIFGDCLRECIKNIATEIGFMSCT
jgi:hypothetical protein